MSMKCSAMVRPACAARFSYTVKVPQIAAACVWPTRHGAAFNGAEDANVVAAISNAIMWPLFYVCRSIPHTDAEAYSVIKSPASQGFHFTLSRKAPSVGSAHYA